MFAKDANSWQLILADLALILFLVAAAALTDQPRDAEDPPKPLTPPPASDVPAQAIYRPRSAGLSIAQWLEQQNPDPRMSLSVVATHRAGGSGAAWDQASALAEEARAAGMEVRVTLREGTAPDLYASLGYDNID